MSDVVMSDVARFQPPFREQDAPLRERARMVTFGHHYEMMFGGSSGGNIKRLSCLRLEKLSTLRTQKPMTPRQIGMEIISGKSSMKQTSIAIKPMTADSPAEYPMMTPLWVGEKDRPGSL